MNGLGGVGGAGGGGSGGGKAESAASAANSAIDFKTTTGGGAMDSNTALIFGGSMLGLFAIVIFVAFLVGPRRRKGDG